MSLPQTRNTTLRYSSAPQVHPSSIRTWKRTRVAPSCLPLLLHPPAYRKKSWECIVHQQGSVWMTKGLGPQDVPRHTATGHRYRSVDPWPGRGRIQQNTSRKRCLPIYCRVKEKQEWVPCPKLDAQTSNKANTCSTHWCKHQSVSWQADPEPATAWTALGINKCTSRRKSQ